jgi:hypothetical protein
MPWDEVMYFYEWQSTRRDAERDAIEASYKAAGRKAG